MKNEYEDFKKEDLSAEELSCASKIVEAEAMEKHMFAANLLQTCFFFYLLYSVFFQDKNAWLFPFIVGYCILAVRFYFVLQMKMIWKDVFYFCVERGKNKKPIRIILKDDGDKK